MEHHLDRTMRLETAPKHSGLYKWAIQEVSANGEIIPEDFIPWNWTLGFTGQDPVATESIRSEDFTADDPGATVRRYVYADLTPTKGEFGPVNYSMFGSNRTIKEIGVRIDPLASEKDQETCMTWGVVAYTSEWDFQRNESPDSMGFHLGLKPSSFERLFELVSQNRLTELELRVGLVPGFYAHWSPSVRTSLVKVLTHDAKCQSVHAPEGNGIDIPRLAAAGDFSLSFTSRASHPFNARVEETVSNEDAAEPPESEGLAALERVTQALVAYGRRMSALTSLQWAAWIAVIMLTVIAFKGCGISSRGLR